MEQRGSLPMVRKIIKVITLPKLQIVAIRLGIGCPQGKLQHLPKLRIAALRCAAFAMTLKAGC